MAKTSNIPLLTVLDYVLSIAVIAPLVISAWRGYWQLLDTYIVPKTPLWSLLLSSVIGLVGRILLNFYQRNFTAIFCPEKRPLLFYGFSRFYTVCYALAGINHWRAVWMGWQIYTGITFSSGAVSAGLGYGILVATKGLNNIVGPPFLVVPDDSSTYFFVPTQFKIQSDNACWFFADVFFTEIITGTLIVCVWRGLWTMMDATIFPNNFLLSSWTSLVAGVVLAIIAFAIQIFVASFLKHTKSHLKTRIIEDLFFVFCNISVISLWRAVWYLLNIYLMPDKPILSNIASALVATFILMLLRCSNSLTVRGALMDGGYPDGTKTPNEYLRFFMEKRQNEIESNSNRLPKLSEEDQLCS